MGKSSMAQGKSVNEGLDMKLSGTWYTNEPKLPNNQQHQDDEREEDEYRDEETSYQTCQGSGEDWRQQFTRYDEGE